MSSISLYQSLYDQHINNFHDRFIPQRNVYQGINISKNQCSQMEIEDNSMPKNINENVAYHNILTHNLLQEENIKKITDPMIYQTQKYSFNCKKKFNQRILDTNAFKVLDATSLVDDFYVNILDWSQKNNLAVALLNSVFAWNFDTNKIEKIVEKQSNEMITSLTWEEQNDRLAVGTLSGKIQVFDFEKKRKIRSYRNNKDRVGTLSYSRNLILSGNKNGIIHLYDIRIKRKIKTYDQHTQEVCGLKWSCDNDLFASGGNDNKLYVYSQRMDVPLMKKTKKAAIKAIDWSPHKRGILASGGGTVDRRLSIWNVQNSELVNEIDTGSQVCCLKYSKRENEIITTHGFSTNEINIWSAKRLQKISTLKGHNQRVLYLSLNPSSEIIVTGAGDETLRFWDLNYPIIKNKKTKLGFESPIILRQLINLFYFILNELKQML